MGKQRSDNERMIYRVLLHYNSAKIICCLAERLANLNKHALFICSVSALVLNPRGEAGQCKTRSFPQGASIPAGNEKLCIEMIFIKRAEHEKAQPEVVLLKIMLFISE